MLPWLVGGRKDTLAERAPGWTDTFNGGPGATLPIPSAADTRMRRFVRPFRASVTATPVNWSCADTAATPQVASWLLSTAQAPATWGAAIEVPDRV